MTGLSFANGQSIWYGHGAYDVGVLCRDEAPVLAWEASGRLLAVYTEAGASVSFSDNSNNGDVVLGPTSSKATFVIWDPVGSAPPQTFSLWASTCSKMVYAESPGTASVPPTVVTVTMPVRMSRLQVTDVTAGAILLDAYDADISHNSATVPVEPEHDVFVEIWAMGPFTYSCNGGAVLEYEPQGMYAYGTCALTNVTGHQTVQLWAIY